ncbi:DinB family protein [Halobacillus sp. A1]|uniref:DinB family protein n=1 Tax=Halobacillus sp. A1 TaxID=2880262 RepID=UPI0020A6AAC8|nr:DinB family protein [Halobacillus sp. A1]MCP3030100.1 DinB family protein [Halobacillus sp. A1]
MYGIEEKRNEVLTFIDGLNDEEAKKKPDSSSWSILEVLEHLNLMEQLVGYQIGEALKDGTPKDVSEKPLHKTTNRDYKVDAPEAVKPKGKFQSLEEAKDGLEKSREATLFLTHNKDEETLELYAFPHPSFGDLNLKQWVEFIGWHELRHLNQMKEIYQNIK